VVRAPGATLDLQSERSDYARSQRARITQGKQSAFLLIDCHLTGVIRAPAAERVRVARSANLARDVRVCGYLP
jgi:hypothetical protein